MPALFPFWIVAATALAEPSPGPSQAEAPTGRVTIRHIEIVGNDTTRDRVIRSLLALDEGARWHARRVRAGREALLGTGWFSTVELTTSPTDVVDEVDLFVRVEEIPSRNLRAGVSVAPGGGAGGSAGARSENLLGLGLAAGATGRFGPGERVAGVHLVDPAVRGGPWRASVRGESGVERQGLSETHTAVELEASRPVDRAGDVRMSARYGLETRAVTGLDPAHRRLYGGDLFRGGLASTAGIGLSIDKRDRPVDPTRGWALDAGLSLSGGIRVGQDQVLSMLGGDVHLARGALSLRVLQPLGPDERWVLRSRTQLGRVASTDGRVVPFSDRMRLGGMDSVRGWAPQSLGVQVDTVQGDDPAGGVETWNVGGTRQWSHQLELQFRALPRVGVSVLGFLDAGAVSGGVWDKRASEPDLGLSIGLGLEWTRSPLGPVRIGVGVPIEEGRLGAPAVQFGFGVSF